MWNVKCSHSTTISIVDHEFIKYRIQNTLRKIYYNKSYVYSYKGKWQQYQNCFDIDEIRNCWGLQCYFTLLTDHIVSSRYKRFKGDLSVPIAFQDLQLEIGIVSILCCYRETSLSLLTINVNKLTLLTINVNKCLYATGSWTVNKNIQIYIFDHTYL